MDLILRIPADVATVIYSDWLTTRDIIQLDSAVCSRRYRASFVKTLNNVAMDCKFSGWSTFPFTYQLECLDRRHACLACAHLDSSDDCISWATKLLPLINRSTSTFKRLILENSMDGLDIVLSCISEKCTHLGKVELRESTVNPIFRSVLYASNRLVEIDILGCEVFQGCLKDITCPSVKKLNLTGCISPEAQSQFLSMCSHATYLTCARLYPCDLPSMPSRVEVLTLTLCYLCDQTYEQIIAATKVIKELYIIECEELTDNNILDLADAYASTLRTFSCRASVSARLSDKTLRYLCVTCTQLESLDLSYLLNPTTLTVVAKYALNLRRLCCNDQKGLTDKNLQSLAEMPQLEDLNLLRSSGFTLIGLRALLNGCKKLKKFQVSSSVDAEALASEWKEARPDVVVFFNEGAR